ncbi:MAG: histidine kinase [Massilia sp.]|jgi:hypothetical protein|nr:histidine kinase [Massilia sp.]
MAFNVTADLFDWHYIEPHFVPFFLLPVFSTLFYLNFLPLKELAPRLASISRVNLVLPLLLLPSSFLALGWAPALITFVITLWMVLALVCGIVARGSAGSARSWSTCWAMRSHSPSAAKWC